MESLERLLLAMGERLELGSARLPGEDDEEWGRIHRGRSMAERLERAFDAASFASELRSAADRKSVV